MFYTAAALSKYLLHLSYPGIIIFFGSLGYIVPVPEEVILLVLGYLAGVGKFHFVYIFLASLLGLLLGDNIFFWLGRGESKLICLLKNRIPKAELSKYGSLMDNNIGKALLASRFILGFRFIAPVLAGTLGVKWLKFFIFDFIIATSYLLVFLSVGYVFHNRLNVVMAWVERFRSFIISACVTFLVVVLIRYIFKPKF